MEYKEIPLYSLHPDPRNVRKTNKKADIEALAENIAAVGLINPLTVVRQDVEAEIYSVIAGNRRLQALNSIYEEGSPETRVPCLIVEGENAEETSLAENVHRLATEPMDEYEAFTNMAKGMPVADIAANFGTTERHVNQRLSLGNLAPKIRKMVRKGELPVSAAQALTLTSDKKLQIELAEGAADMGEWADKTGWIKRNIVNGKVPVMYAAFDMADYTGGITTDLFGGADETYFDDPDQARKLQLDVAIKRQVAYLDEGWGWVEHHDPGWASYDYPAAKSWTLDENDEKVYPTYTAEEKIGLGVIIEFDKATLMIRTYEGRRHKDVVRAERVEAGLAAKPGGKPPTESGFAHALSDDLKQAGRYIVQTGLTHRDMRRQMWETLLCGLLGARNISAIKTTPPSFTNKAGAMVAGWHEDQRNTAIQWIMSKLELRMDLGYFGMVEQDIEVYKTVRVLSDEDLEEGIAIMVGLSYNGLDGPVHQEFLRCGPYRQIRESWRPDDEILGRMTKDQLMDLAKQTGSQWVESWTKGSKKEIVDKLSKMFANPYKSGLKKATTKFLNEWLPPELTPKEFKVDEVVTEEAPIDFSDDAIEAAEAAE